MSRRRRAAANGEDTELTPLLCDAQADVDMESRMTDVDIESTQTDVDVENRAPDVDTKNSEEFPYAVRSSVDPKQECRLILLGGNEITKRTARNFILRTAYTHERINPRVCEMKENCVKGRHVAVVNSPSYWMEHLASYYFFFRGVKTIQSEVQYCISQVFPGPHAFLLVIEAGPDTGKERYLLQAITSVFGKEALDYTLVLFMDKSGQNCSETAMQNSNVQMCGGRYHFLKNTDQSVQKLFRKIEQMIDTKLSKFFIPSSYENLMKINFESWEKLRFDQKELYRELAEIKVTNQNLMKKIEDNKKQHTEELKKCKEDSTVRETELREQLNASTVRETELREQLNASTVRETELREQLNASTVRETELGEQLNASTVRETELGEQLNASTVRETELREQLNASTVRETELGEQLNASTVRETELGEQLNASTVRETKLRKELDVSRSNENELRKEQDALAVRESELRRELDAYQDNVTKLRKELDDSQLREQELREELDDVKLRLSELTKGLDASIIQRGEQELEDRGAETENKEQKPQASGTTPVRRGSKELLPPNLSGHQSKYLKTL